MLKTIISVGGTVFLAGVSGLVVAWVILEFTPINDILNSTESSQVSIVEDTEDSNDGNVDETSSDSIVNFVAIQCGCFSSDANAQSMLAQIPSSYYSFVSNDNNLYRVIAGVYSEAEADTAISELTAASLSTAKISFQFDSTDKSQVQISNICDGYLKIINKTYESDVESVNTSEFKTWVNGLEAVDEGNNVDLLKSLKEYINSISDEITQETAATEEQYIYNILSNFKAS